MQKKTLGHVLVLVCILVGMAFARVPDIGKHGYGFDMGLNQQWQREAVEHGVSYFYINGSRSSYLPVPMILWKFSGHMYKAFISNEYKILQPQHRIFTKLPATFADFTIVIVLFLFGVKYFGLRWGAAAALLYGLHPIAIHNSAYWGQTDALYTIFLLLLIVSVVKKQWRRCGFFLVIAMLTKYQAFALLPFIFFLLPKTKKGILDFLVGAAIAICAVLIFLIPFDSSFAVQDNIKGLAFNYTHVTNRNVVLSRSAFNMWHAIYSNTWQSDTREVLWSMTYRHIGFMLFGLAYLSVLLLTYKKRTKCDSTQQIFLIYCTAVAALYYAFFLFNTQMHERYMFPFIVFAIPFALIQWRNMILYGAICYFYYLNQVEILPYYKEIEEKIFNNFPGNEKMFIARVLTALFFVFLFYFAKDLKKDRWISS